MVIVLFRIAAFPLFGSNTTATEHVPRRTAFTLVPENMHRFPPVMMLMRMVPQDCFGIANDTLAAMFAALILRPTRRRMGEIFFFLMGDAGIVEVDEVVVLVCGATT
jgi:hypothetical protein